MSRRNGAPSRLRMSVAADTLRRQVLRTVVPFRDGSPSCCRVTTTCFASVRRARGLDEPPTTKEQ